jgi:hypothetical protein
MLTLLEEISIIYLHYVIAPYSMIVVCTFCMYVYLNKDLHSNCLNVNLFFWPTFIELNIEDCLKYMYIFSFDQVILRKILSRSCK